MKKGWMYLKERKDKDIANNKDVASNNIKTIK